MYSDFAGVYDRLMRDVDYDAWATHYRALLKKAGVSDGALVLEAACGTGSMTIRLARHYDMLPGDLSQEMLSLAAKKARDAGLVIPFLLQNMRSLKAHKPLDAVIAACDAVNYLQSPADLSRFLRSAFAALRPGGAVAFDVSSEYKLRQVLGNAPQVYADDTLCYMWQNSWGEKTRKLDMRLDIFTLMGDGAWQRIQEAQTQRAWKEEEISDALQASGFTRVRCFGGNTFKKPGPRALRLHFTAQKPNGKDVS